MQERDANNLSLVTYTRGNDLSGTLQGAGGIGGLLARTENQSTINPQLSTFGTALYHADGNGNVTCLIFTNQMIAAKYLYDPYGNMLSMYGSLADANNYRFSSKEWNANSGLYYYLYRFYDSNLQRWVNRDPIQELGGVNLYEFVKNNSITYVDRFGLCPRDCDKEASAAYNRCMNSGPEWPTENSDDSPASNRAARIRKCNDIAQKVYMQCLKENEEENKRLAKQSFCDKHPYICATGETAAEAVIIAGVAALIYGSGGTAGPVLAPALAF